MNQIQPTLMLHRRVVDHDLEAGLTVVPRTQIGAGQAVVPRTQIDAGLTVETDIDHLAHNQEDIVDLHILTQSQTTHLHTRGD